MKITIDVRQDEIDRAEPLRTDCCAVNIAAERIFGVPCRTLRSQIIVDTDEQRADLPDVARDFIYNFDRRRTELCAPFSFEIEDPRK